MKERNRPNFHYPFRLRIPVLTVSGIVVEHMEELDESFTICRHQHICYEILYCIEGNVEMLVEEQIITLQAGEYAVIPPNVWHQLVYSARQTKRVFALSFVLDLKPEIEQKNVTQQEYAFFANLWELLQKETVLIGMDRYDSRSALELILSEFAKKEIGWVSMMRNACMEFLIRIFRNVLAAPSDSEDLPEESNLAIEMLRYIAVHCGEDISLEDIASAVHVSPRHAYRVFESYFNIKMRRALHCCRINIAKDLLQNTDKTVTEIAAEVGYAEPQSFIRWFKRLEGTTVAQYREMYRKPAPKKQEQEG